jgi:hypothetical protein
MHLPFIISAYLGPIAIASAIKNMGAGTLTKLDISSNYIDADQERGLQRICVAGGIELVYPHRA